MKNLPKHCPKNLIEIYCAGNGPSPAKLEEKWQEFLLLVEKLRALPDYAAAKAYYDNLSPVISGPGKPVAQFAWLCWHQSEYFEDFLSLTRDAPDAQDGYIDLITWN